MKPLSPLLDKSRNKSLKKNLKQNFDILDLHTANPECYPYLLQTAAQPLSGASYDILFAYPQQQLELRWNGSLKISDLPTSNLSVRNLSVSMANQQFDYQPKSTTQKNFFSAFDDWWKQQGKQPSFSASSQPSDIPFRGGWFVYLGYEVSQHIESRLRLPLQATQLPQAFATRIPAAIVRCQQSQRMFAVAEPGCEALIEKMIADVDQLLESPKPQNDCVEVNSIEEEDPQKYIQNVRKIKQYIKDGDVFQVNLSRRWQAQLKKNVDASSIYHSLRKHNPSPFFGMARYADSAIISSSPERLVSVRDNVVETRPIAGTRPRSSQNNDDQRMLDELISHPKERAEHIMLIDLERNDLGRISIPGSVKVNELMVLESYAHVHHIVSNVRANLKQNITPGETMKAVFPGGTITGCPKVRCMEIIAELEQQSRGAYTGSMGYVNLDGDMDMNILIRTVVKHGKALDFRAGAGIVYDSIAENELAETRSKAKGLLLALGVRF